MTKLKIGQIFKCRDERHGKRWVRIKTILFREYAHVLVLRGRSRTWVKSDRLIRLDRFNDGKGDYKPVEGK